MKKLIFSFLVFAQLGWGFGQVDTLREESLRKAADFIFQDLDSGIYGPSLLNRSFSVNKIVYEQVRGQYNQTHEVHDYLQLYQDLTFSYLDSTYMMRLESFVNFVENEIIQNQLRGIESDELVLPFGLLYHNVAYIDSLGFDSLSFNRDSLRFFLIGNESDIYDKVVLKSCSPLEFDLDLGYREGFLNYVPELISVSPDISNMLLKVNVGNGYETFDETNTRIRFSREKDTIIGYLALEYSQELQTKYDTLEFYLFKNTHIGPRPNLSSSHSPIKFIEHNGIRLEYAIRMREGCDEPRTGKTKIKRPVIIFPPYRPSVQQVSFDTYFDQFNYANVIDILNKTGYDVIFIRAVPGNARLADSGEALIKLIELINTEKTTNFPNESWENILIGYSMGGQVIRYALKKMEFDHMNNRKPHHHSRLYIPFDSPHQGANIPMFTQFVYQDMKNLNIFANFSYQALVDPASKDMGICHILGSPFTEQGNVFAGKTRTYTPGITSERSQFINQLTNQLNHTFTPLSDLRKSYPTFTRNIAVSVGRNDKNYEDEYSLNPGKHIYKQGALGFSLTGALYGGFFQIWQRNIYASHSLVGHTSFTNRMSALVGFALAIKFKDINYQLNNGLEFDMAQGGYKNEFWDKTGQIPGVNAVSVPVGPVAILNNFGMMGNQNNKLYEKNMSFLPLVSSLHINPTIWQNNNLFFNVKTQGLMYNQFNSTQFSNTYGYPNLGHPSNHFNITPFEAIYCDNQTYEHIKMQATIEDNPDLDEIFLVHTRNFIVNEVESDVVYLQNKTIGDNHTQMDPTYRYRAWYKAFTRIEIGNLVAPKTDPGDYIIEKTGEITVYAGQSVVLKPGFHAQNGCKFHAFIKQDCKQPPENVPVYANLQELEKSNFSEPQLATATESSRFEDSTKLVATYSFNLDGKQDKSIDSEKPDTILPKQNFVARLEEE